MIEILKSLIFGIVEGITEWLPISSTGHLIILDKFLKLDVSPGFFEMYEVVIQLGAVLAVVVLFYKRLFAPIMPKLQPSERSAGLRLWVMILISCLPAAIIGLLFNDKIDEVFYNAPTVAAALILYGLFFIFIESRRTAIKPRGIAKMTARDAIIIGIFQLLALVPGTSRSGATIIGAMLIGFSRESSAEYTFLLAVPVMAGAGLLKLLKFGFVFQGNELGILLEGFAVAFIISIVAIRFLIGFVKKHRFTGFGIYRILLGAAILILFFSGVFK